MKCTKCDSEKESYFSRTEPMGYFCPDCGAEDTGLKCCRTPKCKNRMSNGSPDYCPQCQDDREKLMARMVETSRRLESGDIFPNKP